MGIFSGSKTLEARVAQLVADLATANDSITSITAERDDARAQLVTMTAERDQAAADLAAARVEVTNITAARDTAINNADGQRQSLFEALQFTEEQITAVTVENFIATARAAIETQAQRRAVDIAAGQGVPPVPTNPEATGNADDEVRLAHEAAHAESDPRKRAVLFAKARELVNKTHGNN